MEIYEAMSSLRAVRRLKPDPIAPEIRERVFQAATWAPTGGNNQPWRIIAVTAPDLMRQLGDLYAARWGDYARMAADRVAQGPEDVRASVLKSLDAGDYLAEHFHELPLTAVFCFNPKRMAITDAGLDRPSVVGGGSVYPAVQNFLLACRNEGLGCVLTTLLCMEEAAVKPLLGIPDDWHTCAHVPVGWPVRGGHGPISRRPVAAMVFDDKWGQPHA